jgi:hypothetical protein
MNHFYTVSIGVSESSESPHQILSVPHCRYRSHVLQISEQITTTVPEGSDKAPEKYKKSSSIIFLQEKCRSNPTGNHFRQQGFLNTCPTPPQPGAWKENSGPTG